MEKMSRVNKYKDLRDQITEGEDIDRVYSDENTEIEGRGSRANKQEIEERYTMNPVSSPVNTKPTKQIEIIDDDDFIAGLSLSSEDLSDENMNKALSRVRESDNDRVSFNTRLDILNSIKLNTMADLADVKTKEEPKEKVVTEKVSEKVEKPVEQKKDTDEIKINLDSDQKEDTGENFLASLSEIIKSEDIKAKFTGKSKEDTEEAKEGSKTAIKAEEKVETKVEEKVEAKEEAKKETKSASKDDEFEDLFSEPLNKEVEKEEEVDPKAAKKARKEAERLAKKKAKEAKKRAKQAEVEEYSEDEYEEDDEQKASLIEKILTFLCIALFICLLAIIGIIIKIFFFN